MIDRSGARLAQPVAVRRGQVQAIATLEVSDLFERRRRKGRLVLQRVQRDALDQVLDAKRYAAMLADWQRALDAALAAYGSAPEWDPHDGQ